MLEPDEGKLSSPVLRGPAPSNGGWPLGNNAKESICRKTDDDFISLTCHLANYRVAGRDCSRPALWRASRNARDPARYSAVMAAQLFVFPLSPKD
jgi:hypothetical protein